MSITIDSDIPRDIEEKVEPCMCAQMAESWSDFYEGKDTPEIRDNLKQEANPSCFHCKGTGIETVSHEVNAPKLNLANENAAIFFAVLGVDINRGEMTIPEARRAIIRSQSRTSLEKFVRPEEKQYGKPREVSPGVFDMKPMRLYDPGLTKEKIQSYIIRFHEFVKEVSQKGATKIIWG